MSSNPLFRMNDHGDSWSEPELELETAHGYRVHVRPGDTLEHVATEALADFAELAAAVDPGL